MSKFTNDETGVVVSVDDSKDDRYLQGWTREGSEKRGPGRPKKSDDK
jgi:hypothetical protein